jgi:hypothetical protein
MDVFHDTPAPAGNSPEFSVSELANAVKMNRPVFG